MTAHRPGDPPPPSWDPFRPAGRRFWLAVAAVWTALGLLETLKTWLYLRLQGTPQSVGALLVLNMPWWYLWGILTPLIAWLARRFPLGRGRWARGLPVHAVMGVGLAAGHLAAAAALMYATGFRGSFASLGAQVQWLINTYLVLDVVTYAAVVAVVTAMGLLARLRDEQVRAARLEAGVTEARLHALERELDPHFLFNTLNTVSGLAQQGETALLRTVVARLAELLRTTMDRRRGHEVSLRDELELLDRYLDIERVRLGDRLEVELRVDPSVADALVPTFLLQPLAENAIRHGIAPSSGGGRLSVHARARGSVLSIDVRNVQTNGRRADPAWDEGVGLKNTRARLLQLYGTAASLAVEHADPREACVTVTLPLRHAKAAAGPAEPPQAGR